MGSVSSSDVLVLCKATDSGLFWRRSLCNYPQNPGPRVTHSRVSLFESAATQEPLVWEGSNGERKQSREQNLQKRIAPRPSSVVGFPSGTRGPRPRCSTFFLSTWRHTRANDSDAGSAATAAATNQRRAVGGRWPTIGADNAQRETMPSQSPRRSNQTVTIAGACSVLACCGGGGQLGLGHRTQTKRANSSKGAPGNLHAASPLSHCLVIGSHETLCFGQRDKHRFAYT